MKTEYRDGELYLVEKPVKVFFANETVSDRDREKYTIVQLEVEKNANK